MLKLRSLAFELTPRCNQQCVYCYNPWRSEQTHATQGLATAEICRLVDRLVEEAELQRLTLTGGEPLMRSDLFEIIDHVNRRGLAVVLISNGGMIDAEAAGKLAARDVRYVQVTFAGFEAALHDAHCGADSFEGTSRGVANLVAAGVPVGGSFLCTKKSYSAAEATFQEMFERGVRSHFAFNRFNPSGCGAEHFDELMPTRSNVLSALEQAQRFADAHEVKIHCTMPIPPCMIDEQDYPRVRFGQCSAGTDAAEYAVDPQGRLKLCTLQQHTMGNLLENHLAELIAGQGRTQFRAAIPPFCEPCPHRAGCLGGCGAAAQWVSGDAAQLDPFLAQHVVSDFAARVSVRDDESQSTKPTTVIDKTAHPNPLGQVRLWYDLVYHSLSHLPLPKPDASTLFDEGHVRWCNRWFANHASRDESVPRTLIQDASILARLYAESERGSLLHAWPLLHDDVDDFRRTIESDFAELSWSSVERNALADSIRGQTRSALAELFRTALWSELSNDYEEFHTRHVAPRAEAYRDGFARRLTNVASKLPALLQPIWILSHPLRRHGRLLWPLPATPAIVVGVADPEFGVSQWAPVIQGCHEYFVMQAQSLLTEFNLTRRSPAVGQPGHEEFRILENAALSLGAQFFRNSPWQKPYREWLGHIFPGQAPKQAADRLANCETLPEEVAAAIL